jgi:predicted nucleic acid-binding protein
MDKLFLDANVVVDFLCERSDFYLPAARLMVKSYNKEIELCCSTLTLATASYFMGRELYFILMIAIALYFLFTLAWQVWLQRRKER